jgi:hypothetical protein
MRAAAFFGSIVATCTAAALSTPAANSQIGSQRCESIQDKQSQAACFNQADLIVIDCARSREANESAFCREALGNNKVVRAVLTGNALPRTHLAKGGMYGGNMNNGLADKKKEIAQAQDQASQDDEAPKSAPSTADPKVVMMSQSDPPPLKWSDLKYVFGIKEDCYGEETVHA